MDSRADAEKVVIVSTSESFLAKSLITKLKEVDVTAAFSLAEIKSLEKYADNMRLVVLFMSEDLLAAPETLVYLKDLIEDKELGLILIGEKSQYDEVKRTIPEMDITECFTRPLDIERLIRSVATYMEENTGDQRKKTVLIVDDDITYMRTVYEWLKESYHVGMAASGMQAISYLAKNKADLILLDYEMPIANGPQVLSMLKGDSETDQIPVMFLTGHGDKDSVLSVVGLSPVDYLLKTIDKASLLAKLNNFFGEK